MKKITKYVLLDILRNRMILAYTGLLLIISFSLLNLADGGSKSLIGLLNVLLIVVPLVCVVFSATYLYNSAEFIELLAAQPVKRSKLLLSLVAGQSLALSLAFMIGAGIPMLILAPGSASSLMLVVGVVISIVFNVLAVWISVLTGDKARGIGLAVLCWFYFSAIYDAIVLFLLFQFSDYPLEKASITLTSLNPIDVGRIAVMLQLDVSALLGYTGAVFQSFFSGVSGTLFLSGILLLWVIIPVVLAVRKFRKKDL